MKKVLPKYFPGFIHIPLFIIALILIGIVASITVFGASDIGRPLDYIKNLLTSPCRDINCASPTPVATASATPAGPVDTPKLQNIKKEYQSCFQSLPRIPFGWQPASGATSYKVDISTKHNFDPLWSMTLPYQVNPPIPGTGFFWWSDSDPVFKDSGGNPQKPQNKTRYFWKVTAQGAGGSATSGISSFRSIDCSNK